MTGIDTTLASGALLLTAASMVPLGLAQAPTIVEVIDQAPVSFSNGELMVVTGLLGAVVSAMTFLFRLLLQSKQELLTTYKHRNERLEEQLTAERGHVLAVLESARVAALGATQTAALAATAVQTAQEIRNRLQVSETRREEKGTGQ